MTPEEAIKIVESKSRGRTRYEGQQDFMDEVLVAEIKRLHEIIAFLQRFRRDVRGYVADMQRHLKIMSDEKKFLPPSFVLIIGKLHNDAVNEKLDETRSQKDG